MSPHAGSDRRPGRAGGLHNEATERAELFTPALPGPLSQEKSSLSPTLARHKRTQHRRYNTTVKTYYRLTKHVFEERILIKLYFPGVNPPTINQVGKLPAAVSQLPQSVQTTGLPNLPKVPLSLPTRPVGAGAIARPVTSFTRPAFQPAAMTASAVRPIFTQPLPPNQVKNNKKKVLVVGPEPF